MYKRKNKKQYGGVAKADNTRTRNIPKARIVDTDIDLESLTPNELNIPGVRDAVFGNTLGEKDLDKAKALVWLNRNNGNPKLSSLGKGFKNQTGRDYFQNNTIHTDDVNGYIAELAHASQVQQGDYIQNPLIQLQEYINPEGAYNLPGSIENNAHKVIQPKLQAQYDALKMNKKTKNSFVSRKLKMQNGGAAIDVLAEQGEVFRGQDGSLNKLNKHAPTHDDKGEGVKLGGVESVLSDSYTQVQKGNRQSSEQEDVIKITPDELKAIGKEFGVKVKSGKSLSPSKAFELVKAEKDKLQGKYLKKTEKAPTNKFEEASYNLNLKLADKLPSDQILYDRFFGLQEQSKAENPELFDGRESAQYGINNILDYPHQQIMRVAGGNGSENYSDIIRRKRKESGSLQNYLDEQGYGLVNDAASIAGDLIIDPLNYIGVEAVKGLNGKYFSTVDQAVRGVKAADNVNDAYGIYNQSKPTGKGVIPNPQVINPIKKQYGGKLARGGTQKVAEYQQMLRDAGYDIAVDGAWGAKTQAAYEQFKSKAQSRIGGETGVNSAIAIDWSDGQDFYDKNVDNNLWRASKFLKSIDRADQQPHVYPYLENSLPDPSPSTRGNLPRKGTIRTLGTSRWDKPRMSGAVSNWETPQYQYGGDIDDVSRQGYRYDSPYQDASSLNIQGNKIDMSKTPRNLALIPMKNGQPDYMNMQMGEAWSEQPYEFDADSVQEVPMQFGGLSLPDFWDDAPAESTGRTSRAARARVLPSYYNPKNNVGMEVIDDSAPLVPTRWNLPQRRNTNSNGYIDNQGVFHPFVGDRPQNLRGVPGINPRDLSRATTTNVIKAEQQAAEMQLIDPLDFDTAPSNGRAANYNPVPVQGTGKQPVPSGGANNSYAARNLYQGWKGTTPPAKGNSKTAKAVVPQNTKTNGYIDANGNFIPFLDQNGKSPLEQYNTHTTEFPDAQKDTTVKPSVKSGKVKGGKTKVSTTKPTTVATQADVKNGDIDLSTVSWDDFNKSFNPEMPDTSKLLPLEETNKINKKAQTEALLKSWGTKNPMEYKKTPTDLAKLARNKRKEVQFDFDTPESDFVNGLQLAESAQITPSLRQRVNFYAPQQQFIDPTPYLNEVTAQRNATLQNVNTNSTVGQAVIAQIDGNANRQAAQVLAQIQQQNNQIDYMNQQNQTQAYNQEMLMNNQLDKRYYDESLATQEASRQQRNASLNNWANTANQRRRMMNNLKMNALIAPDFFDFENLQKIGNRNNNPVIFY